MKRFKLLTAAVFAVILIAAMATSASAIDLPDGDILGYWKLDGNLKNETGGPDAEYIGHLFGEALSGTDEDYDWYEGVDGYSWRSDMSIKDGIKFAAPAGQNVTIMEWVKAENCPLTTPLIWWGEQDQANALGKGGEAWIGVWPEGFEEWGSRGPCIGSNNASGNRVAVYPTENPFSGSELPWTHIAISIEYNEETGLSYGKLYYNGELVGEGDGLPYVASEKSYVYFGVNAWNWNINGLLDDVIIYNEVLTDEEIAGIYSQYGEPPEEPEFVDIYNVYGGDETEAPETGAPETDAKTEAPETSAATSADQAPTDAETDAANDEGGCGSAMGAAAIVAAAAVFGCAFVRRR